MKKKLLSLTLALSIITSMGTTAFASEKNFENLIKDTEYETIYQDNYANDIEFQKMIEDYGVDYAIDFLDDVIQLNEMPNNMKSTKAGGGDFCYQYVQNVRQSKAYNCGSATVLQTLYGLNSASAVSGTTNAQKMQTIDSVYRVDEQGSLMVYQLTDALNSYNYANRNYRFALGSGMNLYNFENNVAYSLTSGKPVVLHAKTGYLDYYGGVSTGHYLSLDSINRKDKTVRIVDCNYKDGLYGVHYVPLQEAYNSINSESGRYLIY